MQPAQSIFDSPWLNSTGAFAVVLRSMGRQTLWRRAVDLFLEMPAKQVSPDVLALNAVLSACEEGAAWQWALWLLNSLTMLVPDLACFRKALSSCRKAHAWRSSCEVLETLEGFGYFLDAATLNEAIASCQGADAKEAKQTLERQKLRQARSFDAPAPMQKRNRRSSNLEDGEVRSRTWKQNVFKKLSKGVGTSGTEAAGLISQLRFHYKLNSKEYALLISFLSQRSVWSSALHLFSEMWEVSLQQDEMAYTSVISGCRPARRWQHALELFAEMQENEVVPSVSTMNALISTCGQAGSWRAVLSIFEKMTTMYAIRPDGISLNGVIEAAALGQQWPLALRLLVAIQDPQAFHFNQALRACERSSCWEQCIQLLQAVCQNNLWRFSVGFP